MERRGAIEQVNHYYPYGGLMGESTGGDVQRYPLRRICNPTASNISICNAFINNQETQNIFTHLKCLYSLRLDCKSNRAREIQPSKGH